MGIEINRRRVLAPGELTRSYRAGRDAPHEGDLHYDPDEFWDGCGPYDFDDHWDPAVLQRWLAATSPERR